MKKTLLLLTLLLIPALSFGQWFVLTPEGMVANDAEQKNYLVLEFPGKSQSELFELAKNYIVSASISAKEILSESAPNILSVAALSQLSHPNAWGGATLAFKYTLTFKDERVKVNFDIVKMEGRTLNRTPYNIHMLRNVNGNGIFTKTGKVCAPRSKDDIEAQANRLTTGLVNALMGELNEDW